MLDLLLRPQAENDLEEIFEYTYHTWGIVQAQKYQDELFESMKSILSNPKIGTIYFHKEGNYRKISINRHLIFYRTTEKHCIVVRVLHEKMNLESKF